MAKQTTPSKAGTSKIAVKQPAKKRAVAEKSGKSAAQSVAPAPKARKSSAPAVQAAPAAPAAAPAAAAAAPRRRRSNRRSEQTIDNIFTATEKVVLESGAERISILEVCETAGVSRGTFYRYFASQDELLEAFSRHKRENFHKSLAELLVRYQDPDERFDVVINYLQDYLDAGNSRRMLLVAPEFALRFFKRIFHDAVVRFQDLLSPVFDAWDERLGVKLDRELICDLLIRFVMSEHLVSSESERGAMQRRIGRLIDSIRFGGVTRARR
ncbi:TetR/AcrR family transcriptional regulator [Paraburkholderia aspalathi]|jgi:AcrR family transcriptional regulator|uniref:Transcriptional regulator, TetR family n=1 Tax=Paraburkholderia aspalathi TaxID=1324617 RepID=A0A1I7D8Q2_9BURK|nr:TetR/AcrR family transcriptional regulator [Paraburkholderia aspalathi]SFU08123.1 transcriptional regulator, TetR family [Paraburkholderia aspalathi]